MGDFGTEIRASDLEDHAADSCTEREVPMSLVEEDST